MTQEELIQEYAKCYKDTPYAIKTYLETYDNTQSKYVPFILFPEQEMMLKPITITSQKNIVKLEYRQRQQLGYLNKYSSHLKPDQKKY